MLAECDEGQVVTLAPHPGHRLALQIIDTTVQIDVRRQLCAYVYCGIWIGKERKRFVCRCLGDLELLILGRICERRAELLPKIFRKCIEGIASSGTFHCKVKRELVKKDRVHITKNIIFEYILI